MTNTEQRLANITDVRRVSYLAYINGEPKRFIFNVPHILPDFLKRGPRKGEFVFWLRNFADTTVKTSVLRTNKVKESHELLELRIVEIPNTTKNSKKTEDYRPEKQFVLCLPYGWGKKRGYALLGYRNYVLTQLETYVVEGEGHDFNFLFET